MALVTPLRPLRQDGKSAFQRLAPEPGALRVPVTLLQHACELPDLVTVLLVLLQRHDLTRQPLHACLKP